jgi:hypothetical protein
MTSDIRHPTSETIPKLEIQNGLRICRAFFDYREASAELGERSRFRTASPLTPALSPLRGEGARYQRVDRSSRVAGAADPAERCGLESSKPSVATPSPLNGERAGVRGERSTQGIRSAIGFRIPNSNRILRFGIVA